MLGDWHLRLHHAGTDPDKREILGLHSHPFLEIVIIERGRGRDERPTGSTAVAAPAVIVAGPDDVHRLHVDRRQRMIMTWFGLTVTGTAEDDTLVGRWLAGHRPVVALSPALHHDLIALQQECADAGPGWTLAATDRLRLFVINVLRATVLDLPSSEAADADGVLIDHFLTHVRRHPALGPSEIAQALQLHERRLTRLVRRRLGCSPLAAITRERMALARLWLSQRDRSVAAVAQALGYADARHFARRFRAATGVPPAVWRQDSYRRERGEG